MLIRDAIALARQWLAAEAPGIPGFCGAFVHGSANWLPPDADLPSTSDLDIMIVLSGDPPPIKLGKFRYEGLLLEISYLASSELASPDQVLGVYHLAGSFRRPSVLADTTGELTALNAAVAAAFAQRHFVLARCAHALSRVRRNLTPPASDTPWPLAVSAWLFACGVTTHVLLTAGLRNPTVRLRYVAVRALLEQYARLDMHERLLSLLGCAQLSPTQVAAQLSILAEVFDATVPVVRTPVFYASDLTAEARPIAIDGSAALIRQGLHREAIFWIVATFSRCMLVLAADAPSLYARYLPAFARVLADLGITSPDDLARRRAEVEAFLPALWTVTEELIAANMEIKDDPL